MKNILIFSLLITTTLTAQSRDANFEFSGIDQFLNIVKKLEANTEPLEREWDILFGTPGYSVLLQREFNKSFFIENWKLVFMPANSQKLQEVLKSGKNLSFLKHYIKVRDNTSKIRDQQNRLSRGREHSEALKRTLEYLPQRRVSSSPPVSFVIFESNGRGSSPIVVDLIATLEWDYVSFLAHEYHHWYRSRQLQINLNVIPNDERSMINAFSLIEAEGIADMIDKKDWYTKPSNAISDYARRFLQDVQRTPSVIFYIDQALIQISKYPEQKMQIGQKIFSVLPQRGHTTGYYMARLILEHFSKKELSKCVGNPFKFLLLYNKAARLSGQNYPEFSPEAEEQIKKLQANYSF